MADGYLAHFVASPNVRRTWREQALGTNINNLRLSDIEGTDVPVPPLPEQERIVAAIEEQLSRLDAGVRALERAQQNIEHMQDAALQSAVLGRSAASFQLNNELPPGWRWVPLAGVLAEGRESFRRGPFGSALTKASFVDAGYKVYEQYCPINDDCSFARYYISPERYEELASFAVKGGDFLVSCSGSLGRITKVPADFEEGVINQALLRIRTDKSRISDDYFLHLFRSPYFQSQLLANSTGTAMVNVKGVKELKAIPIPLPPLSDQDAILGQLSGLNSHAASLLDVLRSSMSHSRGLRSSLLAAAFSGKLATQDPSDEPASVLLKRIAAGAKPTRTRKPRTPSRQKARA
jgi:type I restriction enzyme S subunit